MAMINIRDAVKMAEATVRLWDYGTMEPMAARASFSVLHPKSLEIGAPIMN